MIWLVVSIWLYWWLYREIDVIKIRAIEGTVIKSCKDYIKYLRYQPYLILRHLLLYLTIYLLWLKKILLLLLLILLLLLLCISQYSARIFHIYTFIWLIYSVIVHYYYHLYYSYSHAFYNIYNRPLNLALQTVTPISIITLLTYNNYC